MEGENINKRDVETKVFWELGKFTSRFVTIVKQSNDLKAVFYHKLFEILKQHQNKANELRDKILAMTANSLALREVVVARNRETVGQQEVLLENNEDIGPSYDTKPLEKVDSNITPTLLNMSNNEGEVDKDVNEHEKERVLLASLNENMKLDIDESKKINNELKKANTSLANELEKYKHFKHKEEAELECAKSYGLLAETKMISKWHQDEAAREVYAVKQKFSKMEEQIFAHEIQILKCHLKRLK
ncbi:hypothetical protein Tco_0958805 [Tanacetum coccineum]